MILLYMGFGSQSGAQTVRKPAVAGTWYPNDAQELTGLIDGFFNKTVNPEIKGRLVGFVSPHAGYVYSGPVAAHCYKLIKGQDYDTVIIFGNAHRVGFMGAAIDSASSYQTPLGSVALDKAMIDRLISEKDMVVLDARPHAAEHSIESQIPFLQTTLNPGFKIIPILFGYDPGRSIQHLVARIPEIVGKNNKMLYIASTDLTHFPAYKDSCRIDQRTVESIASMDIALLEEVDRSEMARNIPGVDCVLCGKTATETVMQLSRNAGADRGVILKRANSGDVAIGSKDSVVGYGAVAFFDTSSSPQTSGKPEESVSLTSEEQNELLRLSRNILETYIKTGNIPDLPAPGDRFRMKRGAFVTLHIHKQLRGCIGYIMPEKQLWQTIIENTVNAATRDPRFPAVRQSELDSIDIEISVLTPPREVDSHHDIQIGRHGVILKKQNRQAVFLPQVAPEQGWDLEETLSHLAMKAGLDMNAWKEQCRFEVFEAQVFGEKSMD